MRRRSKVQTENVSNRHSCTLPIGQNTTPLVKQRIIGNSSGCFHSLNRFRFFSFAPLPGVAGCQVAGEAGGQFSCRPAAVTAAPIWLWLAGWGRKEARAFAVACFYTCCCLACCSCCSCKAGSSSLTRPRAAPQPLQLTQSLAE